jgi:hypothetical protein
MLPSAGMGAGFHRRSGINIVVFVIQLSGRLV